MIIYAEARLLLLFLLSPPRSLVCSDASRCPVLSLADVSTKAILSVFPICYHTSLRLPQPFSNPHGSLGLPVALQWDLGGRLDSGCVPRECNVAISHLRLLQPVDLDAGRQELLKVAAGGVLIALSMEVGIRKSRCKRRKAEQRKYGWLSQEGTNLKKTDSD